MSNLENTNNIIVFRQSIKSQLDTDLTTFLKTKGYDTLRDYEFSIAKELSTNPKCSLNRQYYKKVQDYLDIAVDASISYLKTGNGYYLAKDKKSFIVTKYSLNQAMEAVIKGHTKSISKILINNYSIDSFIEQIKERIKEAEKKEQEANVSRVRAR